jgi:hypothetical protein
MVLLFVGGAGHCLSCECKKVWVYIIDIYLAFYIEGCGKNYKLILNPCCGMKRGLKTP